MNKLQLILANKHTTISSTVYGLTKMAALIAVAWWPEHEKQIRETAEIIESGAVVWLGATAGDAKPTNGAKPSNPNPLPATPSTPTD